MLSRRRLRRARRSPSEGEPLRVAIVGLGGITTEFHNWPERVLGRALMERGHHVVNIGYHQPKQAALRERKEVIDGIAVRRVPVRHWPNRALRRALNELGPFDIIHLMHPRNVLAYETTRWAQRRGIPTVFTWLGPFHDRYLIDDRERPYNEQPHYERLIWNWPDVLRRTLQNGRLRDHLRNYWLHQPLRAALALLPCSEHEAGIMHAMNLQQPLTVVPLWIDVARTLATPVRSIDLPRPALLFIGQLTPRKGYDLLVQSLPEVLERYPTATVQVVSGLNEADRSALEALAEREGVRDHVHFRGRVDDEELVNLLRSADVYVTPTRYEGFGLTLLEAMAAGSPVVASAIPVVNETIEHGVNGWLVAPESPEALAEGILRVLGDATLREELRAGSKEALATRFAQDRLVAQVEGMYRTVIHGALEEERVQDTDVPPTAADEIA